MTSPPKALWDIKRSAEVQGDESSWQGFWGQRHQQGWDSVPQAKAKGLGGQNALVFLISLGEFGKSSSWQASAVARRRFAKYF